MGPVWVCTRFCANMLRLFACALVRLLTVGAGVSVTFLPALGTLFLLLGCLVKPCYGGFRFALPSCILCAVWLSFLGNLLFSEEEIEGE